MTRPGLSDPVLRDWFVDEIATIEDSLQTTPPDAIPDLFIGLPLDVFARLLLEPLDDYPNLRAFIPMMPTTAQQQQWTGDAGLPLMTAASRFVEKIEARYTAHTGQPVDAATVLDYGFGWGRIARVFAKLVPTGQIYGVDAWQESVDLTRALGVKGRFEAVDEKPDGIPFEVTFDLIYAFSLFTHLSEKTHLAVLDAWRSALSPGGLVAVTVRPRQYWEYSGHDWSDALLQRHDERGFAFEPHQRLPDDSGDIAYGDTSIARRFVEERWTGWSLVGVDISNYDPLQVILYLCHGTS